MARLRRPHLTLTVPDSGGVLVLAGLTAAEVTPFVVETRLSMRKETAKLTVTALLLGWLQSPSHLQVFCIAPSTRASCSAA
jgi:hypothetical protein